MGLGDGPDVGQKERWVPDVVLLQPQGMGRCVFQSDRKSGLQVAKNSYARPQALCH